MPTTPALATARTALRRFARTTNLMLTGRAFTVIGDGDDADALRTVMRACGGRDDAEHPDYAFVTDGVTPWAAAVSTGAPVVVDLQGGLYGELTGAVRPGATVHAEHGARAGIVSADGVDLVAAWPALPSDSAPSHAGGRIAWAEAHMPLAASFARQLKLEGRVRGVRIAVSMVLEPKTAVLALLLRDAGAEVSVFSHRYETDDAVAAELRSRGMAVFADPCGDDDTDERLALELLDGEPDLLLDDGAHVIRLAHDLRPSLVDRMIGGAEETTSGVRALRRLQAADGATGLRMPVVAVNDAVTKTRFDNRYGTGQSCVFAVADVLEAAARTTAAGDARFPQSFDGAVVTVIGFGPVGQGVAQFASALGAEVRIVDTDPRVELEARFAGHRTGAIDAMTADADIVISATGVARTITLEVLRAARDHAVFAVAGGVDDEIEMARLRATSRSAPVSAHLERFSVDDGHIVHVIDDGECVNITAGEGNPIEIMDLSFAAQLQAVSTLLADRGGAQGLVALPEKADREIARRALENRRGTGAGA